MNAPQDAWAGSLAERMITRFRSQALAYVKVDYGAYNEATGEIASTQKTYPAAGAVASSTKVERDGVQQGHEMEAWIDHKTVPWPICSGDQLEYLGRVWKITEIESYGSGGDGWLVGPVYLTAQDGKVIATINGKAFVVLGPGSEPLDYAMYASRVVARAE